MIIIMNTLKCGSHYGNNSINCLKLVAYCNITELLLLNILKRGKTMVVPAFI